MPSQHPVSERDYANGLVWFRRDLRIADHTALHQALTRCRQVWCLFVFDTDILDPLIARGLVADRRVEFIHASIVELAALLRDASPARKGGLLVRHGRARDVVVELAEALEVDAVFSNEDYEPDAVERDADVADRLRAVDRAFHAFKDQVVFAKRELLTKTGTPFSVFTPYRRAWLAALAPSDLAPRDSEGASGALAEIPAALDRPMPTLEAMGFTRTNLPEVGIPAGASGAHRLVDAFEERLDAYHEARDFPAARGTSYLSVHLRFGTISIRALARLAWDRAYRGAAEGHKGAETWLSELTWRDFYFQVLHHRPDVGRGAAFKAPFDRIRWVDGAEGERRFDAWCRGATGYPLVDAAMMQINGTGFMHNRLRMVTASFLSKDLGVDWRRGERYFAEQLNDYDLSANNGGWQWAASSGCDAQPWFRIFNPVTQSRKFDPEGAFIRHWLPQLAKLSDDDIHAPWLANPRALESAGVTLGRDYPETLVDHDAARLATLERYAVVRSVVAPTTDP